MKRKNDFETELKIANKMIRDLHILMPKAPMSELLKLLGSFFSTTPKKPR